jgi:DNA primase/KaiC/GvpD/RAD55 family RecA-like ATPase
MNEYLEDLSRKVKCHLTDYVNSHGHKVANNGTFQCFNTSNHEHGDTDFSATISKSNGVELWYCFVCKKGGTIYDLAYEVEGLPISGEGFVLTTIELATRFGISVDREKLPTRTDKAVTHHTLSELYKEIDSYIRKHGNGVEHLTSGRFGRSYTKDQAEDILSFLTIGCVDSEELTKALVSKFGDQVTSLPFYEPEQKLLQPYLFNNEHLVMSINNRAGIPQAFSGRCSVKLEEDTRMNHPKYIHTKGFESVKKHTLFLFDAAKEHIKKSHNVRIVEGAFDAISMHVYGYRNTVAILGSTVQQEAIDMLAPMKVYTVTYILDPDKAGLSGLKSALTTIKGHDAIMDAVLLPEKMDPDKVLRSGDTSYFESIRDAVQIVLENFHEFHDISIPRDIRYKKMVDFVTDCSPHSAKYRDYARVLSKITGYHEDDIIFNLQESANSNKYIGDEEKRIMNSIFSSANKPMAERIMILEDSTEKLRTICAELASQNEVSTWHEFMKLVNGEARFPKILKTGLRLDQFADIECGALTFVSGWPSNGKSSVLQHLTVSMARKNKDLKILYVATDDVPMKAMAGFIGIITGMPKSDIKMMIENKQFLGNPQADVKLEEIQELFSHQIIMRGLKECSSTDKVKQEIANIRKKHDRDLLVVVDAMNNLDDIKKDDQRVGIENAIRNFKNMAVTYDAALIPVSHLTKQDGKEGERPRLKNLKGTSFIEYEAKTVLLVHMDAHYHRKTDLRWKCGSNMFPVVEINVAKDKDKEANNVVPVHFNPLTGEIISPSDTEHSRYVSYIEGEKGPRGGDGDDLFSE